METSHPQGTVDIVSDGLDDEEELDDEGEAGGTGGTGGTGGAWGVVVQSAQLSVVAIPVASVHAGSGSAAASSASQ